MAVLRPELPHTSFTSLRNCWLRDSRISYKAKGLLGYLMSHAVGYKCSQAQMVRESADGKDAVRTALDELEAAGYLSRTPARDAGRFSETDYTLRDPFDGDGRIIRPSAAEDARETRRGGFSDADKPPREIRPIEDNGEKTNPTPPESGAQLRLVEHPEEQQPPAEEDAALINKRANALAREHFDAAGKLGGSRAFMGLRGIVADALTAGHPDEQVRAALGHLRSRGRAVTRAALGPLLTGASAETVGGRRYGAAVPYRDPDPDSYRRGF